ncbi:Unconventional Myosin-Xv [Manis pentadactyla]|nr:Unconventional Myosin-Xv [Manis pentadactyla]
MVNGKKSSQLDGHGSGQQALQEKIAAEARGPWHPAVPSWTYPSSSKGWFPGCAIKRSDAFCSPLLCKLTEKRWPQGPINDCRNARLGLEHKCREWTSASIHKCHPLCSETTNEPRKQEHSIKEIDRDHYSQRRDEGTGGRKLLCPGGGTETQPRGQAC